METATIETVPLAHYDAYKDLGVEWLEEIPEHWEVRRLKNVCKINHKTLPEETKKDFRLEYVDISSVSFEEGITHTERYLFKDSPSRARRIASPGDTIISTVRTYLKAIDFIDTIKSNFIYSTGFAVLSPFLSFDPEYLAMIVRSDSFTNQVMANSKGMSYPAINSSELSRLHISLPPLKEQIRITSFLNQKTAQIDQAIAQKERLIALLQERRQVMIHQAVTQGLNPDVPIKDSGVEWIGKIPAHWEVVSNRSLFVEKNKPGNETLPILSVSIHTAVSSEELSEEDNTRGTIRIQDKSSYKRVDIGDIAFNMMRAWQGAIGAVSTKGMVSPAYIVAEPLGDIEAEFFEHQYRTSDFIQQMNRFSKGITDFRKRLYWEGFKQLKTVLPPKAEQIAVVKFIEKFSSKTEVIVDRQKEAIRTLKEYRATLINSAVTGKIKV